mgnify:CR=1 FL=1
MNSINPRLDPLKLTLESGHPNPEAAQTSYRFNQCLKTEIRCILVIFSALFKKSAKLANLAH